MRALRRESLCAACGARLAATELPAGYLCGACRARPPAFDRLLAAFAYAAPLDRVIGALKFRRLEYLGEALATATWVEAGAALEAGCPPPDALVPVPLHWRRRLARGFNQAEVLAAGLARRAGLPLARVLHRAHATAPQARLPRADRWANPRRAFVARGGGDVARRHLVLVDDVVTTGATVHHAALALKRAGAARVTVVAVARTLEEPHARAGPNRR